MTVIPTVRCKAIQEAVAFYTGVLDFTHVGTWPAPADPAYSVLMRDGDELHLSSHAGDGAYGQAIVVLTDDADAQFRNYLSRGLDLSAKPQSPVHQGPVDQTWGTREFYIDDPSGNTLRFVQRKP